MTDSPYFELVIAAVAGIGTGLGLIIGAVVARSLLRAVDRDREDS